MSAGKSWVAGAEFAKPRRGPQTGASRTQPRPPPDAAFLTLNSRRRSIRAHAGGAFRPVTRQ
jgi:hypothetical protein